MSTNIKEKVAASHEAVSRIEMQDIIAARVSRISKEFKEGFEFIKFYPRTVSFFGSARLPETDPYYVHARSLAGKIVSELQYTILTGGGGGIMEAANRGAFEAGGESVGLNIHLPHEQQKNGYTTDSMDFNYFFVRKVALSFAAETYIFFPGGFGTFDELFEILTLIQTRKIRRIPIVLYGVDFWTPLQDFIRKYMLEEHNTVDEKDLSLYTITDDMDEIVEIVRKAPIHS